MSETPCFPELTDIDDSGALTLSRPIPGLRFANAVYGWSFQPEKTKVALGASRSVMRIPTLDFADSTEVSDINRAVIHIHRSCPRGIWRLEID